MKAKLGDFRWFGVVGGETVASGGSLGAPARSTARFTVRPSAAQPAAQQGSIRVIPSGGSRQNRRLVTGK